MKTWKKISWAVGGFAFVIVLVALGRSTGICSLATPEDRVRNDMDTIRSAVALYIATEKACPTLDELVEHSILNTENGLRDPWDTEFWIHCPNDQPFIRSAGRDEIFGTEDDLTASSP